MEIEVKEASFVVKSDARVITVDTRYDDNYCAANNTMKMILEDNSEMNFSFRMNQKYSELVNRHFPYTCIRRPVHIAIEFPIITELELQQEVERKRQIADLKADIKSMESRLKRLEAIDKGLKYGY